MKTKIFSIALLLTLCCPVNSQVAKWLVWPEYELIFKERDADVLNLKSLDGSTTIWSMDGKELISTKDYLAPFHEGLAVVTEKKGNVPTTKIKGIYTEDGKKVSIKGDFVLPVNSPQTFFSDHLLVKEEQNADVFRFMLPDGSVSVDRYVEAKPFQNGYSTCKTYEKWEKKKGLYHVLLDKNMQPVDMVFNKKVFDADDISFISSVNDEKIGIVVADKKVFYFDGVRNCLTPLYVSEQEENPKNQAEVQELFLSINEHGETILKAHAHKTKEEITVEFDDLMKPLTVKSNQMNREFVKKEPLKWNPSSSLSYTTDKGMCGIVYNDTVEVCPPQFKKIVGFYEDNAIVVLQNGKYGVLQVLGDKHFSLKLNDGDDIPFKHRRFKTNVYLDMPADISPDNVRLVSNHSTGFSIDEYTVERRKTETGNRVQYQCILNFPDSLPDEMLHNDNNKLKYPVQVQYHGLISPILLLEAYAWHYKYFNLETSNVQVNGDGTAIFQLNISIPSSEDLNYPLQVDITSSDTLKTEIVSYNAFTHKCSVSPLKEGINNIEIHVLEEGCPPITLPFELSYTKPIPRKHESGKVSIKQKVEPVQKKFRLET